MSDQTNITQAEHPYYTNIKDSLRLWDLAYLGGIDYVAAALEAHDGEKDPSKAQRIRRSSAVNTAGPICDCYASFIFRPPWQIKLPAKVSGLAEDVDRQGNRIENFFKSIAAKAAMCGYVPIVVDMPTLPPDVQRPLSKYNAMRIGMKPYLYSLDPLDLQHWKCDDNGKLVMALVREHVIDPVFNPSTVNIETADYYRWRLWFEDQYFVIDADGKIKERAPNLIGRVPIVIMQFKNVGNAVVGLGLGQRIEPIQKALVNLESLKMEIFYKQAFSQLVGEGMAEQLTVRNNKTGEINGEATQQNALDVGISTVLGTDEVGKKYYYISPDASQVAAIQLDIERKRVDMYQAADLSRGSVTEVSEQSGKSKAYDFLDTNQAMADAAKNFAQTIQRCGNLAARYQGDTSDSTEVTPPVEFGIQTLTDTINDLKGLTDAQANVELLFEQNQAIWRAMNPGKSDKEMPQELKTPMSYIGAPPRETMPEEIQ